MFSERTGERDGPQPVELRWRRLLEAAEQPGTSSRMCHRYYLRCMRLVRRLVCCEGFTVVQ